MPRRKYSQQRGSASPPGDAAVKVAILDDYAKASPMLDAWTKLAGHEVTVFSDHVREPAALAARLAGHHRKAAGKRQAHQSDRPLVRPHRRRRMHGARHRGHRGGEDEFPRSGATRLGADPGLAAARSTRGRGVARRRLAVDAGRGRERPHPRHLCLRQHRRHRRGARPRLRHANPVLGERRLDEPRARRATKSRSRGRSSTKQAISSRFISRCGRIRAAS